MNIRRIIREEIDELDWIRKEDPIEYVVDDILSKSIIKLTGPDSHYTQLRRHEIIEPGKQGPTIAKIMKRDYGINDWETRNEIMDRLYDFMYMMNNKYWFVLEHRLSYLEPYPITLLDVKNHLKEEEEEEG
jgi:hypothetical protein